MSIRTPSRCAAPFGVSVLPIPPRVPASVVRASMSESRDFSPVAKIFQLAYASARQLTLSNEVIVDGIVLPAMRRNRLMNITGCLWFNDHHFLQILEGEEREVRKLMAVIRKDARHTNLCMLSERLIGERAFLRFSMRVLREPAAGEVDRLLRERGRRRINSDLLASITQELMETLTPWGVAPLA